MVNVTMETMWKCAVAVKLTPCAVLKLRTLDWDCLEKVLTTITSRYPGGIGFFAIYMYQASEVLLSKIVF